MKKLRKLLLLFLTILLTVEGQDFTVQYQVDNQKVNQLGVYRVSMNRLKTVQSFAAGTKFKTYFPASLTTSTANGAAMSICRRYFSDTKTTTAISNCLWDSTNKIVTFSLASSVTFSFDFNFEIGYFKNPSTAISMNGFRLRVETSTGSMMYDFIGTTPGVYIQPGDITSQTVTPASLKVADTTTYTFSFKITDSVPVGSKIEITFPLNDVNIPDSLTSADVSVTIYGKTPVNPTITLRKTRVITMLGLFPTALVADSSKTIQISLARVVNPYSMSQTSSFKVETMDSNDYYIDRASLGLTVQMNVPADIFPSASSPSSMAPFVRSFTFIVFDLSFTVPYEGMSYLEVTFPSEIAMDDANLYCNKQKGFSFSENALCEYINSSPFTVRITDTFNDANIIFNIGYARNPSSNQPTSSFGVKIYNSLGSVVCAKQTDLIYSADPDVIYLDASVRAVATIGVLAGNSIILDFTATNYISQDEFIKVRIPYDQLLVDSTSLTCSIKLAGGDYSTVACNLDTNTDSNYFQVTLAGPCIGQCQDLQEYFIILTGVRNPYWIVDPVTKSIEIYSITNDKLWIRDQIVADAYLTPDLTEAVITTKSLNKNGGIVNHATDITVTFTPINPVQAGGVIRIYLPENAFYIFDTSPIQCTDELASSAKLSCSSSLNADDTNKGVDYIEITDKCTVKCQPGTSISIKVANFKNRGSVKGITNQFTIRTYTKEMYKIDKGIIKDATGLTLLPAPFVSLALPSPLTPIYTGVADTYTFKITSENGIANSNTGTLSIEIPADVAFIAASPICQATVDSASLVCSVDSVKGVISVKNKDLTLTFSNKIISVTLSGQIRNPFSTKPSKPFKIYTTLFDTDTSSDLLVDQDLTTVIVTADTPNALKEVTVVRNDVIINEATDFVITFTTFNPVPAGGVIIFQIPKVQFVITSAASISFSNPIAGQKLTALSIDKVGDDTATHYLVTLKEWCSVNSVDCPAVSTLHLKMSEAKNYKNTKFPKYQFQIDVKTSDGYSVDQVQGINASPLLSAGPFNSVQFNQDVLMVGEDTILTVTVVFNNEITTGHKGKLDLKFPVGLFYTSNSVTNAPLCIVSGTATTCTTTTSPSSMGDYYSGISIVMDCDTTSCAQSVTHIFTISNMRNRFTTKAYSGQFSISTLDDEDSVFDSNSPLISATNLPLILAVNNLGNSQALTRSVKTVSYPTDLTFTLQISVRLTKNSILQVNLPSDSFDKDAATSIRCADAITSATFDCVYQSIANYHQIQFKEYCSGATTFCDDNTTISVTFTGFRNRYNIKTGSTKVYYKTFTSDMLQVEESQNALFPAVELVALPAVVKNDFTLSTYFVGKNSTLLVNVQGGDKLLQGDYITLLINGNFFQYQPNFKITASLSSDKEPTLQSAFTTYNLVGQTVNSITTYTSMIITMQSPKDYVMSGQALKLSILGLSNAQEDKLITSDLIMNSYTQDGSNQYSIASGTLSIVNQDIFTPSPIKTLTIKRDKSEVVSPITLSVSYSADILIAESAYLSIMLPKSQVVQQDDVTPSCYISNVLISCTKISEDSDYVTLTSDKTLCITESQCAINAIYNWKILGFKNPAYKVTDQKTFIVKILSQNDNGILTSDSTIVNASPDIKLSTIYNFKVTQPITNMTTFLATSYNLQFTLPYTLDTTFKLLVNFPVGSVMPQQDNGVLNCKNYKDSSIAYKCSIYKMTGRYITILSIDDFCKVENCLADSTHQFVINNVSNSDSNKTRDGNIVVQTSTSDYHLNGEGVFQESLLPAFVPIEVQNYTVTRETNKVGQTSLDLTISVIIGYAIPDGSMIMYYIPRQQVLFSSLPKLSCSALSIYTSPKSIDCVTILVNSTHVLLQVQEWCKDGCPAQTEFKIKIRDTQNPLSLDANDPTYTFGVLIQDSTGQALMETRSGVVAKPALNGVNFTSIMITRDTDMLGSVGNLSFTFQLSQRVALSTNFTLQIPKNTSFVPQGQQLQCFVQSNKVWNLYPCSYQTDNNITVYGQSTVHNITLVNYCTKANPCYPYTLNQVRVTLQNPRSLYNQTNGTTKFNLTMTQDKLDIGRGFQVNQLPYFVPGVMAGTVKVFDDSGTINCDITGLLCSLQLDILTENPFMNRSNSYLQVQLPSELSTTKGQSICNASLFSKAIVCKFYSSSIVQIRIPTTYTILNYTEIRYSFNFQVNISNVRLPSSLQPTSTFTIQTLEGYGVNTYVIDQLQSGLTLQMSQPRLFDSINITRDRNYTQNNTNLEFSILIGNQMPKNTVFQVTIPTSQAIVMSSSSPKCKVKGGLFGYTSIKCTVSSDQQVILNGACASSGCASGSILVFVLTDSFIQNPSEISTTPDSIKVVSYLEVDTEQYLIQTGTQNLFITPDLIQAPFVDNGQNNGTQGNGSQGNGTGNGTNSTIKEGLSLSNLQFYSNVLSDLQKVEFNASFKKGLFTQDYLKVQFANISFNINQFYNVEAKVNNLKVSVKTFQTTNDYGETILDGLYIDCALQSCKGKQTLQILIEGFINPYFKPSVIDKTQVPKIIFAELKEYPSTVNYQTIQMINDFLQNTTQNKLKSTQSKLSNYKVGSTNTELQLLFTLQNKPKIDQSAQVILQIPSGYSVPSKPTCYNMFENTTLQCQVTKNQLVVSGYFASQTVTKRLLQTLSLDSSTSTVAIAIGNITNSKNASMILAVSVESGKRIYASDNQTFTIQSFNLTSACTDSNCSECNVDNPSYCTKCVTPSQRPLLEQNKCKAKCSTGFFEYNSQCYPCSYGCKECQNYDLCSKCNLNQTLIDGQCFDKVNIFDQPLVCPDGSKRSDVYGCVSASKCQSDSCQICGVDIGFCLKCTDSQSVLNGQCVTQCPFSYTRNSIGQCDKCDSNCLTCNGTAKKCQSCRIGLSSNNVLDKATSTCGTSCSQASLPNQGNALICDACISECSSCSGSIRNCTSCSYNRESKESVFYYGSQCMASCPSGYKEDYDTHQCKVAEFTALSAAPLYLIISCALVISSTLFSTVLNKRNDDSLGIMIALFTQVEAVNRLILLILLWRTEYLFTLCVDGMNIIANSILGIYFTSVVTDAICKQIKSFPQNNPLFKAIIVLSQFTGTNTMRLITSNFLKLKACSSSNLRTLPYFFKPLENMSLISILFNVFQVLVSLYLIAVYKMDSAIFGFAINSLILNPVIIVMLVVKYRQFKELIKQYVPVTQVSARQSTRQASVV